MTEESSNHESANGDRKTAGIIIVGDEVLKGQVVDSNSSYLAKELHSLGIKLKKISVISDDIEDICLEVKFFSSNYDYVLTTGGIGPTHDDMTMIGVGQAFNEPITINQEMANLLDKWLGDKGKSRDVYMKMAHMPISTRLIFESEVDGGEGLKKTFNFPIMVVHNVYVFPGIPQYLQRMFPRLRPILQSNEKFHTREIFVARDEMSITPELNEAVSRFKESVIFGSYPVIDNLYFSTRLTMESTSESSVENAKQFLNGKLPSGSLVDYEVDPIQSGSRKVYEIVENPDHPLHKPVKIAVEKVEEGLGRFGIKNLCISFNGGKDCTALLHILHAVVQKKLPNTEVKLQGLCIKTEDPFTEMEDFILQTSKRYNLDLWRYDGNIMEALKLALIEHPEVNAIFMGTRRSDPSGKSLEYFQMTDPSWPQVTRVSPLLDWSYGDLWSFLRTLTLPYCPLYDRGYTSIGSQSNTVPNASLQYVDSKGKICYKPAYTLPDHSEERNGRG